MLKSYLTSTPYQKFVIIQDSLEENGRPIFDFLLQHQLQHFDNSIHYFLLQGRVKDCTNCDKVIVHNLNKDALNWDRDPQHEDINQTFASLQHRDIVFVDSLAHCIYQYGLAETYRIFNTLKHGVTKIVALLHLDLLDETWKADELFNFLSTLSIQIQPKFSSDNGRLHYMYKKPGGKVIKQVEEYFFENLELVTKKIEKPDPKKILEDCKKTEVNPDDLATFRISLTDKEKEAKDQLVLPYLPKNESDAKEEGKIFYKFDEQDDWDEEDPDDDLDI